MKSKIFGLIFCGLFAVAFTAGGIFAGVIPLWDAVRAKVGEYSRVAVEAKVVEVSLERGSKRTTGVRVTYAYTWRGARYASDRISMQHDPRSRDNLSDWHERWHRTLNSVKQRDGTITAWVDPNNPSDAVLDRDIRWAKVWFAIPFAFLFTAVGLGATWVFFKLLFSSTNEFVSSAGEPVALDRNPAQLRPTSSVGLAVFGIFWSLLAVPMCAVAWGGESDALAKAITSLFAVFGVWMIWYGVKSHVASRTSDAVSLTLSPQQPTFGEPFRVSVNLPLKRPEDAPAAIAISLVESIRDERGSSSTTRSGASQNYIATKVRADASIACYEVTMDAPKSGHASGGLSGGLIYSWTLNVAAGDQRKEADFSVTLAPAAADADAFQKRFAGDVDDFATAYRKLAASNPNALLTFVSERVCKITQRGSEWSAEFPAPGMTGGVVFTLALALAALGWAFGSLLFAPRSLGGSHTLVWVAVCVVISLIGLALHFSTRRFAVTISKAGVFAQRESALTTWRVGVPLLRLSKFEAKQRYSSNSGSQAREHSAIFAVEVSGGARHRVSPTLSALGALEALQIEMNDALERVRHFGITPAPEDSKVALISSWRRWFARVLFAVFALALVGATYVLLHERGRVWPILDKL